MEETLSVALTLFGQGHRYYTVPSSINWSDVDGIYYHVHEPKKSELVLDQGNLNQGAFKRLRVELRQEVAFYLEQLTLNSGLQI